MKYLIPTKSYETSMLELHNSLVAQCQTESKDLLRTICLYREHSTYLAPRRGIKMSLIHLNVQYVSNNEHDTLYMYIAT